MPRVQLSRACCCPQRLRKVSPLIAPPPASWGQKDYPMKNVSELKAALGSLHRQGVIHPLVDALADFAFFQDTAGQLPRGLGEDADAVLAIIVGRQPEGFTL